MSLNGMNPYLLTYWHHHQTNTPPLVTDNLVVTNIMVDDGLANDNEAEGDKVAEMVVPTQNFRSFPIGSHPTHGLLHYVLTKKPLLRQVFWALDPIITSQKRKKNRPKILLKPTLQPISHQPTILP